MPKPRSSTDSARFTSLAQRHPLLTFFTLAYVLAWIVWLPYVLGEEGTGTLALPVPIYYVGVGTFIGPALAAIVVTKALAGPDGVQRLLRRILHWRVALRWWLISFLGIPALYAIATVLGSGSDLRPSVLVTYYPWRLALVFLFGGPLGEEIGWRGFALPRMEERFGPLRGTLLLGVGWAWWHLPLGLFTQWRGDTAIAIWLPFYTLVATALGVFIAWVYNHTGSLLLAMLIHAVNNAFGGVVRRIFRDEEIADTVGSLGAVLYLPAAVLIIALTRRRLSWRRDGPQSDAAAPARP